MGGIKKYFDRQFQWNMLYLEHESATDFYLSSVQKNRSPVPLLLIRIVLFLTSLAILLASLVLMAQMFTNFGHWFIFLTHWGLILVTVTTGLACLVSVNVCLQGPIDASFGLPWYVKAYWVMFNVTVPVAFFISIFYFLMLTDLDQLIDNFEVDPVLDVFVHGINSVIMLSLLLLSSHPVRLLHCYCCLGLGIVYLIFNIVYYYAGGMSPFGEVWIYPQLDWRNPGLAAGVSVGAGFGLILMHALITGISVARDRITKKHDRSMSLSIN